MKIVVDTNLIISASLSANSVSRAAFKALSGHVVVSCEEQVMEVFSVVKREKFDKFSALKNRIDFVMEFINSTHLVRVVEKIKICRDAQDDIFINLAISANAEMIISGDKDLLELNGYKGIKIITPREFLDKW